MKNATIDRSPPPTHRKNTKHQKHFCENTYFGNNSCYRSLLRLGLRWSWPRCLENSRLVASEPLKREQTLYGNWNSNTTTRNTSSAIHGYAAAFLGRGHSATKLNFNCTVTFYSATLSPCHLHLPDWTTDWLTEGAQVKLKLELCRAREWLKSTPPVVFSRRALASSSSTSIGHQVKYDGRRRSHRTRRGKSDPRVCLSPRLI